MTGSTYDLFSVLRSSVDKRDIETAYKDALVEDIRRDHDEAIKINNSRDKVDRHSHVTHTYADGHQYIGDAEGGQRHGQGTFIYPDGDKYVGQFSGDMFHGKGTFTRADGETYTGEWKDDKRHGQGTSIYPDGDKYVGDWNSDEIEGFGTFTFSQKEDPDVLGGEYVGAWKDSKRHGQGACTYTKNGDFAFKFEGEWVDGHWRTGSATRENGEKYIGEWQNGKYHGQGAFTWPDGRQFIGGFKTGMLDGQGVLTFHDGSAYRGEFKAGKLHGYGRYTWPDEEDFVGQFREGIRVLPEDSWSSRRLTESEAEIFTLKAKIIVDDHVERMLEESRTRDLDATMLAYHVFYKGVLEAIFNWGATSEQLYQIIERQAAMTLRIGLPDGYGETLFTMEEDQISKKYGDGESRHEGINAAMQATSDFVQERITLARMTGDVGDLPIGPSFLIYQLLCYGIRLTVTTGMSLEATQNVVDQVVARKVGEQ